MDYLQKSFLMSHRRNGILAEHPQECIRLRLVTLNNLSCCARHSGKANLALKYANEALKLQRILGHQAETEHQVRSE